MRRNRRVSFADLSGHALCARPKSLTMIDTILETGGRDRRAGSRRPYSPEVVSISQAKGIFFSRIVTVNKQKHAGNGPTDNAPIVLKLDTNARRDPVLLVLISRVV